MSSTVEAHRKLIPMTRIESTGEQGSTMVTDMFINAGTFDQFVEILTPNVHMMRKYPECLFYEICQNPTDETHVRIVSGWTKGSEWFADMVETQEWFAKSVEAMAQIADKAKGRRSEHFNRIPVN